MYNGIGLGTARGSGTNGYVQRNLSFIRKHKETVDYKTEEELNKLDQQLNRKPNEDILEHHRKRQVELKCMEMQELMEEQGYNEEEVEKKVSMFRKMLMEKEGVTEKAVEKDELGRPIAKETHQLAEAANEKHAQLRAAFGLSEYYVAGSSFDPERKKKEEEAKAMAQAKYSIVRSSSSESRSPSPKRRKKKSSRKSRSQSPSPARKDKKKRKKHRRDR